MVERYYVCRDKMVPHADGAYVRYEDFAELETLVAELAKGNCYKCGRPLPYSLDDCPEGIMWCDGCAEKEG